MAVLRTFEKSCRAHSLPRITFSQTNRIEFQLPLLDPEINGIQEGSPEIFAIHWFVHLLNSDRRECLNRCVSCGRYFVRTRMPSRGTVTKRGVFCLNHRHLRKGRSVTAQRNVETSIVIRAAAQAENRWGKLSSDTRRNYGNDDRNYIAAQIKLYGKTRKWVTRNFDAIDREAQQLEGNYATR